MVGWTLAISFFVLLAYLRAYFLTLHLPSLDPSFSPFLRLICKINDNPEFELNPSIPDNAQSTF